MAPPVGRIFALAIAVKDALVDGYTTAGVDLPPRRLVTPGLPAWDCMGLYVQVERAYTHDGSIVNEALQPVTAHPGHAMRAIQVGATLLRCTPTIPNNAAMPPAADEEAVAELVLNDSVLMFNLLLAAQKAGDLPGCNGVAFDQWQSAGPEGGLVGGLLRVRLGVGG